MADTAAAFEKAKNELLDPKCPIATRMRAVFTLRSIPDQNPVPIMTECFEKDDSALLKHELCYALGQVQKQDAVPFLREVLSNKDENSMVRHEAAEALAAIRDGHSISILEEFSKDPLPEVAETCELAVASIKWELKGKRGRQSSPYTSVDPARPYTEKKSVAELREMLLDTSKSLFERYRAMFSLRDDGSDDAVKHEVAFVLGQMQKAEGVEPLIEVLADTSEHAMVRHEAAEALGAIVENEDKLTKASDALHKYLRDPEQVVAESCAVALDIQEYLGGNEFTPLITSS